MRIIVDTCIWSLALRRGTTSESEVVRELTELIKEVRVQLIGPIRQELLSGIKSNKQFSDLKQYLSAFPDLPLESQDYEKAAEFFNTCRSKGIQGSNTDFLICAVTFHRNFEIFTTDKDFVNYQQHLPIKLYQVR
jgi:predicted nucleic acid-binding protein